MSKKEFALLVLKGFGVVAAGVAFIALQLVVWPVFGKLLGYFHVASYLGCFIGLDVLLFVIFGPIRQRRRRGKPFYFPLLWWFAAKD